VGSLWVDGSFLTQKIDPEDVDTVLVMQSAFVDAASREQLEVIHWFTDEFGDLRRWLKCHNFPLLLYPDGHPLFWEGAYRRADWLRQWGFSRGNVMKGIAVVELHGGTA
jgi:hypothetical protein